MAESYTQPRRARIFVSCGQTKDSTEVETARGIAKRLEELGFEPYIAVEEQTLSGLRDNIFRHLRDSEYLVFVDFKREKLVPRDRGWLGLVRSSNLQHRGSLFSHQELAIASYLETEVLTFQEHGVKQEDGILRFLQANAISFKDRHLLPNVIADQVQRRDWDPNHRNELILERNPEQYVDAWTSPQPPRALRRFFHVHVRNLHRYKTALNCYVYLEKATKLNPPTEIPLESIEFKWAGYTNPNAHISPLGERRFDALWLIHDQPGAVGFNVFSDSTEFIPRIPGLGEYELRYAVVADNFPIARISLILTVSETLDGTTLKSG